MNNIKISLFGLPFVGLSHIFKVLTIFNWIALHKKCPRLTAALAAQGGAAVLTERGDATFEVSRFSSADREWSSAPTACWLDCTHWYSRQESIEVRPFVPKGFLKMTQHSCKLEFICTFYLSTGVPHSRQNLSPFINFSPHSVQKFCTFCSCGFDSSTMINV